MLEQMDQSIARVWINPRHLSCKSAGKKEDGHQNELVTAFVDFKSETMSIAGHANIFHVKPAIVVKIGAD